MIANTGRRRAVRSLQHLVPLVIVLVAAGPAAGQQMAAETRLDLWCGLAFGIVAESAPGDAGAEQQALAARFGAGGAMLTDRARAALLETGMGDEQLAALLESLRAEVAAQVNSADIEDEHSFEECQALLPG